MAVKYYYTSENKQVTKILGKAVRIADTLALDADTLDGLHADDLVTKQGLQKVIDERVNAVTSKEYVRKPWFISPTNGATGVEYPKLEIMIVDNYMTDMRRDQSKLTVYWEVATDNNFNNLVEYSYKDYGNILTFYCKNLSPNTTYYARARVSVANLISKWTDPISFTTGAIVRYITRPINLISAATTYQYHRMCYTPTFVVNAVGATSNVGVYQYTTFSTYKRNKHGLYYNGSNVVPATPIHVYNALTTGPQGMIYYTIPPGILESDTEYIVKTEHVFQDGINTYKSSTTYRHFKTRSILNFTTEAYSRRSHDRFLDPRRPHGVAKLTNRYIVTFGKSTSFTTSLMRYDTFTDSLRPLYSGLSANTSANGFDMINISHSKILVVFHQNNSVYTYNHETGVWAQVQSWTPPVGSGLTSGMSLIKMPNGDIYGMEFKIGTGQVFKKYDTVNNVWVSAGIMNMPAERRYYNVGVIDDDKFIVMGGSDSTTGSTSVKLNGYVYSFSSNSWTTTPDMPGAINNNWTYSNTYSTIELRDHKIVFIGVPADDGVKLVARNYVYNSIDDSWTYEEGEFTMDTGIRSVTMDYGVAYTYGSCSYSTFLSKISW